ncbi:MAG: BrnA antitoxin family protein [Polaromonas sp.]|nr:BrnA antitoxin family protein [Polaromonas sp.]
MNAKSKPSPLPWTDPDDAPEITEQWVKEANLFDGEKLVRRGRPKAVVTKAPVKLRLDADVLLALRATGEGWQTRINDTLRASLHLAGRL